MPGVPSSSRVGESRVALATLAVVVVLMLRADLRTRLVGLLVAVVGGRGAGVVAQVKAAEP